MLNFSAEQVRPWWRILEALRFFGRGMADWWSGTMEFVDCPYIGNIIIISQLTKSDSSEG